jgi:hypothetical protein
MSAGDHLGADTASGARDPDGDLLACRRRSRLSGGRQVRPGFCHVQGCDGVPSGSRPNRYVPSSGVDDTISGTHRLSQPWFEPWHQEQHRWSEDYARKAAEREERSLAGGVHAAGRASRLRRCSEGQP